MCSESPNLAPNARRAAPRRAVEASDIFQMPHVQCVRTEALQTGERLLRRIAERIELQTCLPDEVLPDGLVYKGLQLIIIAVRVEDGDGRVVPAEP